MYRVLVAVLCLLACSGQSFGQAELVIEPTEHERWHGEDNLYGELYGRRMAMHEDRMVTVGFDQAVVWQHNGTYWWPWQVIKPGIGPIADVGFDGIRIVFGAPRAPYGQDWPIDGQVAVYGRTVEGWVLEAS